MQPNMRQINRFRNKQVELISFTRQRERDKQSKQVLVYPSYTLKLSNKILDRIMEK